VILTDNVSRHLDAHGFQTWLVGGDGFL
jgi:hypothetical protein